MVNQSGLLMGLLVLFIIFFIIVGVYYIRSPPPNQPVDPKIYQAEYDSWVVWGEMNPVDGERGTCNLYEFMGKDNPNPYICMNSAQVSPGIPGEITLQENILDSKTPLGRSSCIDIDQIVARKVTRQCVGLGVSTDSVCVGVDGKSYKVGETETLYTTEKCGIGPCPSELVFWGVGYGVVPDVPLCNNVQCLKSTDLETVIGSDCSIADPRQIYQLTRYSILEKPAADGILASITDRTTGLCMIPNADKTELILSICGNPVWALIKKLKGNTYGAEQQTCYIGDLNTFEIIDIFNSSSIDEIIVKISSYGVTSLQLDTSNNVVLLPYANYFLSDPPDVDTSRRATSQYVNYTLYNTIMLGQVPYSF